MIYGFYPRFTLSDPRIESVRYFCGHITSDLWRGDSVPSQKHWLERQTVYQQVRDHHASGRFRIIPCRWWRARIWRVRRRYDFEGSGKKDLGTIDLLTRPEGLDKRGTDPFWVILLLFAFLTFSLRRVQFQEKPTITLCSTWTSFAFWVTWISRSAKITSDLTLRSTQVPKTSLF